MGLEANCLKTFWSLDSACCWNGSWNGRFFGFCILYIYIVYKYWPNLEGFCFQIPGEPRVDDQGHRRHSRCPPEPPPLGVAREVDELLKSVNIGLIDNIIYNSI